MKQIVNKLLSSSRKLVKRLRNVVTNEQEKELIKMAVSYFRLHDELEDLKRSLRKLEITKGE